MSPSHANNSKWAPRLWPHGSGLPPPAPPSTPPEPLQLESYLGGKKVRARTCHDLVLGWGRRGPTYVEVDLPILGTFTLQQLLVSGSHFSDLREGPIEIGFNGESKDIQYRLSTPLSTPSHPAQNNIIQFVMHVHEIMFSDPTCSHPLACTCTRLITKKTKNGECCVW